MHIKGKEDIHADYPTKSTGGRRIVYAELDNGGQGGGRSEKGRLRKGIMKLLRGLRNCQRMGPDKSTAGWR